VGSLPCSSRINVDSDTEGQLERRATRGPTGQDADSHGILAAVDAAGAGWCYPPPRPLSGHSS